MSASLYLNDQHLKGLEMLSPREDSRLFSVPGTEDTIMVIRGRVPATHTHPEEDARPPTHHECAELLAGMFRELIQSRLAAMAAAPRYFCGGTPQPRPAPGRGSPGSIPAAGEPLKNSGESEFSKLARGVVESLDMGTFTEGDILRRFFASLPPLGDRVKFFKALEKLDGRVFPGGKILRIGRSQRVKRYHILRRSGQDAPATACGETPQPQPLSDEQQDGPGPDFAAGWGEYRRQLRETHACVVPGWEQLPMEVKECWCAGVWAALEGEARGKVVDEDAGLKTSAPSGMIFHGTALQCCPCCKGELERVDSWEHLYPPLLVLAGYCRACDSGVRVEVAGGAR